MMATTILIKSENETAINAIKVLAEDLEMEVSELNRENKKSTPNLTRDELIKSGIIEPGDPSAKLTAAAGIWTGRNITLADLRKKAWKRKTP